MDPNALILKVLEEIRDSIRETNSRVDRTNTKLEETRTKLEETRVEMVQSIDTLCKRIVEAEVRTGTAILALSGDLADVKGLLRSSHDLGGRVGQCEKDIDVIKARVGIK